jgi:prevent-host-death family protein
MIPAGEFKAHCLALMDQAQKTHEPITVTKRGKPIVQLVPVDSNEDDIFGFMKGKAEITGDIVSPAFDLDEWDCLK